jgi:hypothetical protein
MKWTTRLRFCCCVGAALGAGSTAVAQIPDASDANIAGIPVNYTEAKAETYSLPDVLKTFDGQPVTDAKTWNEKRRPELLKFFESEYYGKVPASAPKVFWQVVREDREALEGKAIMKVLAGHMGSPDGPAIDLTLYTPSDAKGPVPVLTSISFNFGGAGARAGARGLATGAEALGRGPAIGPGAARARLGGAPATAPAGAAARGRGPGGPPRGTPAELIGRGYGSATINYSSIESDRDGQPNVNIVRKLALRPGQEYPDPDEWGTIASWAWGISRVMDYYETDPAVDARRVAITGTSRLGKTVTWAGANDPRIALVIACCGGEGGAALARRNYGETIAHLVAPSRYPYQFASDYAKYAADPGTSPVDTHCLLALMAPRPILLSTASTDGWSDPYGEFCAAIAATPVYKLLGKQGLDGDKFPAANEPVGHELSYVMVQGGHGTPNWDVWLKFMDTYLKPGT